MERSPGCRATAMVEDGAVVSFAVGDKGRLDGDFRVFPCFADRTRQQERDDNVPSPKGAGVCDSSTQPFCTSKQPAPLPSASIAVSSRAV